MSETMPVASALIGGLMGAVIATWISEYFIPKAKDEPEAEDELLDKFD